MLFRRVSEITIKEDEPEDLSPLPWRARLNNFWRRLSALFAKIWQAFVNFVAEAKGHTVKAHYMERFSKVLRLRTLRTSFRRLPRVITSPAQVREEGLSGRSFEVMEQGLIKSIEKDPANHQAYEELGKLYLEQKKYGDAKEVYEYLVNVHPARDVYFSSLGLIYYNLGSFDNAIVAYNKAIQLRPEATTRLINLSLCYEAKGRFDEAIESVERALEISPEQPQYLSLLADFLIKTARHSDARETLEKILELEPTNQEARQRLMDLKF